jgi:hypothetical protein
MSINPYEIDERKRDSWSSDYNGMSRMYRQAIQEYHFKRAKEIEADMKREDERLSKEGEQ